MISTAIQQLVNYGLDTGLILPDDEIYIRNQLLMTMQLDDFTAPEGEVCYTDLESILKALVDDAVARGVCEDNSTARDLFDTKLMGVLTPRPSIVRANFEERYENEGPQAATDWFYKFSQDTDYIRRYRIKRDLKWVTKTEYGDLGHHHQPVQAGKRPQGHCRRKACTPERLPQVPAVRGERGLRRPHEPPRPRKPPHHPADHQRQRVEFAVQPLRLLQRALHRVQQPAHTHEDRAGNLPQAAGFCGSVPPLFCGQQR